MPADAFDWMSQAPKRIERAGDVQFFHLPPDFNRALIDLGPVEWISPIGVVGLLALFRRAKKVEGPYRSLVINAPKNQQVREYLESCGFLSTAMGEGLEFDEGTRAESSTSAIRPCLPATLITGEWEMERAAADLESVLDETHAPSHVINHSHVVMTEVANNAWQHGSDCYVMAQTHTGRTSDTPGLHIAIADFGRGFRQSLSTYGPESEAAALELAFEQGVTRTHDSKRGLGLTYVMEAIDKSDHGANLSVVSHNAWIERADRSFTHHAVTECGGVFVTAYFPFFSNRVL